MWKYPLQITPNIIFFPDCNFIFLKHCLFNLTLEINRDRSVIQRTRNTRKTKADTREALLQAKSNKIIALPHRFSDGKFENFSKPPNILRAQSPHFEHKASNILINPKKKKKLLYTQNRKLLKICIASFGKKIAELCE